MKWVACFFFLLGVFASKGQHTVSFLNPLPSSVKRSDSGQADKVVGEALIPFEVNRGMIIVKAQLNGRPGSFIVDTGAPLMVVNKPPEATAQQEARSFASAINYTPETIDRFQWAEMAFQNLDALALDISHLEASTQCDLAGMVGYNALNHYEVLFDYRQNRMALYDARRNVLHRTASPLMEFSFELQDHLPVVKIQAGERKLAFGIDTGAGINLIDRRWLEALPAGMLTLQQDEAVRGMDQQMQTVPSALISGLELDGLPLDDQMGFLFTDLQHLQTNTGLEIDGLLGFPFLKQLVFSINYPKRKLYIWHLGDAH
ncbi:MAG: pepsin/retropepsin-like aspartic protease family protein [Saprospiraceae bacterium]|nr:pepsin/retropepsin-like aspartic protease family protein [Saprospiraceae bacterium]